MADEPKKEEPKLKGQAIIEDLKVKLKEIDKQADAVIKDIAQQAENYKADPSSVSGRVDVSKLEEILQRADSIIYDPKVAEVVDDARNAKAVKYIVNGLHDKVRRSIQHDLVEKYPDLKLGIRGHAVEGTGTYYRQDSSKEETFGGVFSEFVVKNIDESRLNYENKRLSLIKAIPFYARVKQNPEYKGIGQDFQNIRKVALSEKSILDTIFDKMAEYKEQDVATIITTARKNHHKPSELSNAYRVFATYAKNFRGKSGFPDENIEVDQNSREKALEKLLNGDPKRESNIPKDLIPVIRALGKFLFSKNSLIDFSLSNFDNFSFKNFATSSKYLLTKGLISFGIKYLFNIIIEEIGFGVNSTFKGWTFISASIIGNLLSSVIFSLFIFSFNWVYFWIKYSKSLFSFFNLNSSKYVLTFIISLTHKFNLDNANFEYPKIFPKPWAYLS